MVTRGPVIVLTLTLVAATLMGRGLQPRVGGYESRPLLANGSVAIPNASGTPVIISHFRARLPASFQSGVVLQVYADAGGTAAGTCSLVNATEGSVIATVNISNGAATIYESSTIFPPLGEFDYLVRFRVSSGAGTVNIYDACLHEPTP